ncbi:tetratricopeptide repeat protein [Candidatus Woesearchaeota archaeon]|nr:tetratricopeptide repeat protein [Candidatus Woesearchaeota archaeon]
MAKMGFLSNFEAQHGSRETKIDKYFVEVIINGELKNGFVAGIDHTNPMRELNKITDELSNSYLDDIVGRATNENIADYIFCNMGEFPIYKVKVEEFKKTFVELFDKDVDINGFPARLSYNKGHSLLLREKPDLAVNFFTQAIEKNKNFVEAYNLRGRCLKYLNNFKDALADFNRAISINEQFGEGWRNKGNAHLYLNEFDEMIIAFNQAIELMPQSSLAINNRGFGYFIKKDFQNALNDHLVAIEIDPHYAEAHYDKAMALKALGRRDEALKSLKESRMLKKTGKDTYAKTVMY